MRLAFFSPVPPAPSGVCDYLVDLLPWLPETWSIDIFVDDDIEPDEAELGGRARCYPHREWPGRHSDEPYELNVYQVGNNLAHAYALPYVLGQPGLLVLHDAVIHPSRALHAVESGEMDAYREAAERCRPDVGRALGHMVAGGLASPQLFFRYPLCEDLVRASLLTGVHGPALAEWVRALVPEARICSLAHWRSVPEANPQTVAEWRQRLLGNEDGVIAGCFGNIDVARRLDRVLQAVSDLRHSVRIDLVVVGSVDPALDLPGRAAAMGIDKQVHWLGRVGTADFGALLRSVDFAVNLRFPPARASSGVLHQLLEAGVPTVITDLVHWTEYPAAAVKRVPAGPDAEEMEMLRDAMERWAKSPEERDEAAQAAKSWAQAQLGPTQMADSYVRAVSLALERGP